MTAARTPETGVSTSGGLTVDIGTTAARAIQRRWPGEAPAAGTSGRVQDLTRFLGTVSALVSVPAAGVTGLVVAGPRACVAAAGAAGVAALYFEHSSRYPRRRMPSPAARPALCAGCAGAQVDVVSAQVRRFPPRLLLQAWCVDCWSGRDPVARDIVLWLPAPYAGTWDDMDALVDDLLPLVCSDCDGRQGRVGIAVWEHGDPTERLLCGSCARARADSPDGERLTGTHLDGVARTKGDFRALLAAAYVAREPLVDLVGLRAGANVAGPRGGDSR